jgi:hypothetical protein
VAKLHQGKWGFAALRPRARGSGTLGALSVNFNPGLVTIIKPGLPSRSSHSPNLLHTPPLPHSTLLTPYS